MKFHGDVRPLSHNPVYMGVVFSGPIDEAIQQAKDAPNHGISVLSWHAADARERGMSRNRIALLQHLNLL
jgi:hypothetical protein